MHMIAERELLNSINYDEESRKSMEWGDVKKRLMTKLPKVRQCDAEIRLLEMKMTKTDDIVVFTTHIQQEYDETCLLLGVDELSIPFNEVLEVAVTGNMTSAGKAMFGWVFKEDMKTALLKIEDAFRDRSFKENVFHRTNSESSSTRPYLSSPIRHYTRHTPHRNEYIYHHHRSYQRARCSYHDQGSCRYGNACWYEHVTSSVNEDPIIWTQTQ